MADIFAPLKNLLREAAPPSVEIGKRLEDARQIEAVARQEHERLTKLHVTMLDADEAVRARNRSDIEDAGHRIADAELYVTELTKRLGDTVAKEDQATRLSAYHAANEKAERAAAALTKEYGPACRKLVVLLRQVMEAQLAVDEVNGDLPAGGVPLSGPEVRARGLDGLPRVETGRRSVKRWCYVETGYVVPEELSAGISPDGSGGHYLRSDRGSHSLNLGTVRVEERAFEEVEFLPEIPGTLAESLLVSLNLPGVQAFDTPFFQPIARWQTPDPAEILAALDTVPDAPAPTRKGATPDTRAPAKQLVPLGRATA